jgi:hypothetical protein
VILSGCSGPADPAASADGVGATATATATSAPTTAPPVVVALEDEDDRSLALGVLATLELGRRATATGFDVSLFHWKSDTDGNDCDTRNDVLRRDLAEITFKPGTGDCVVTGGSLLSPYSGDPLRFTYGKAEEIHIDHVVALSDAWESGADQWDDAARTRFANDPLNIVAVEGAVSLQKRDGDAAMWMPSNEAYRCEYVARKIAVKDAYDLRVTPAETLSMTQVLESCPDFPAFTQDVSWPAPGQGNLAPAPAPTPDEPASKPESKESNDSKKSESEPQREEKKREETKQTSKNDDEEKKEKSEPKREEKKREETTPKSEPKKDEPQKEEPKPKEEKKDSGGKSSYKNCDDVRAHGAAPIRVGDPGYSTKLDRDGDGVGCEN